MDASDEDRDLGTLFWVLDMFPDELAGILAISMAMADLRAAMTPEAANAAAQRLRDHAERLAIGVGVMQEALASLRLAIPEGKR